MNLNAPSGNEDHGGIFEYFSMQDVCRFCGEQSDLAHRRDLQYIEQ